MTIAPKLAADFPIDQALVRALLAAQHPDLAHLTLTGIGEGWDNTLYRLGDALTVRLPRRAASAALIAHEQRWLPELAPRLTLPIPCPLRVGVPGCGFPWSWSIGPWLTGESAATTSVADPIEAATDLAQFLRALQADAAPSDAPRNPYRGVPLRERTAPLHEHAARVTGLADDDNATIAAALARWDALVSTPAWSGPPLWIHGDLHPANLLISEGRLSAVLDFGDIAAGDPATDLSIAWMLLPPDARAVFRTLTCGRDGWLDAHTWTRGRAWALALGVAYLAHSRDNPAFAARARKTIAAALDDLQGPVRE